MMLYYIHILYRYLLIYVRTMFHIHRDWFGAPTSRCGRKIPQDEMGEGADEAMDEERWGLETQR